MPEQTLTQIRSAGTLVGAILESAGYHYQSVILDAMNNPFHNEVGGLVYLVSIIIGLVAVGTRGNFNFAGWLLIGPPLFFAVLFDRGEIPNARWQYGKEARPQAPVDGGVGDILPGGGNANANVSTLFARYVQMISSASNEIVSKIGEGRGNSDLWMIINGELFGMMHTGLSDNVGLQSLIHSGLVVNCAEIIHWANQATSPFSRQSSGGNIKDANSDAATSEYYIDSRQYALRQLGDLYQVKNINLDHESRKYITSLAEGPGNGTDDKAETFVPQTFSCFDIWRFTLIGIMRESKRLHGKMERFAEENGITKSVLNNLYQQAHGVPSDKDVTNRGGNPLTPDGNFEGVVTPEGILTINRIIANYFFRNEMSQSQRGSLISYFASRTEVRNVKIANEGNSSVTERSRISLREWSEKERLIHAASSLPYYQGLALYFLGTFYPFFALLLLVPGKHSGFFKWFTLWLWVKSWDVGFAVVMVLNDVLFSMLVVQKQALGAPKVIENDLITALATLKTLDPTFQMSTYYSIMAVCVLAIPSTTAQLILGGMNAGASLISEGAAKFGDHYADAFLQRSMRESMFTLRADAAKNVYNRTIGTINNGRQLQQLAGNAVSSLSTSASSNALPGIPTSPTPTTQHDPVSVQGNRPLGQQAVAGSAEKVGRDLGFGTAPRPSTMGQDNGLFQTLANPMTAYNAIIGDSNLRAQLESNAAGQEYLTALARWNQDISEEHNRLYEYGAILGFLPLPWANMHDDHPDYKVFNMALTSFKNDINRDTAGWELLQNYGEALLKATKKTLDLKGDATMSDFLNIKDDKAGLKQKEQILNLAEDSLSSAWKAPLRFAGAVAETGASMYMLSKIYDLADAKSEGEVKERETLTQMFIQNTMGREYKFSQFGDFVPMGPDLGEYEFRGGRMRSNESDEARYDDDDGKPRKKKNLPGQTQYGTGGVPDASKLLDSPATQASPQRIESDTSSTPEQ